jgi:cytosine deaminase
MVPLPGRPPSLAMDGPALDLVLADALLDQGRRVDLGILQGRIATVAPAGSLAGLEVRSLDGALVLPGLVDGHIHLDKTFLGIGWVPHRPGATVRERIETERALLRDAPEPVIERARRLVRQVAALGTTAMRSHVDIDDEAGLANVEALIELRSETADLMHIELVAFPQSGVAGRTRIVELLDAAITLGADVVGGLDPAGIDGDIEGQLGVIFGIAERRGVGLDIHLHDPGELGCYELVRIADRTRAAGLEGRVAVSHAYALGAVGDRTLGSTAEALARAGVSIMTNGPGPEAIPPVRRLTDAGVRVFVGSDNIRDAWSPYGNGDMLERARLVGYRAALLTDEDLRLALALVTTHAAAVMGLPGDGIREGAPADLVAVHAAHVPEAVAAAPPRIIIVKRGRIVAEDGRLRV